MTAGRRILSPSYVFVLRKTRPVCPRLSSGNRVSSCDKGRAGGTHRALPGYGLQVAQQLLVHCLEGDRVVATLRKPSALSDLVVKHSADQLLVLKLDIVSPPGITSTFTAALARLGRINIVYDNAGLSSIGEVEGTPDTNARHLFEVNFWGAVNVTREAVRVFRDENKPRGGSLLQASNIGSCSN